MNFYTYLVWFTGRNSSKNNNDLYVRLSWNSLFVYSSSPFMSRHHFSLIDCEIGPQISVQIFWSRKRKTLLYHNSHILFPYPEIIQRHCNLLICFSFPTHCHIIFLSILMISEKTNEMVVLKQFQRWRVKMKHLNC